MTNAMLEIQVIGELEVRLAGATAELPAGRRVRALLGWLAVHPGRHPRSRLAGQFWPDVLEASARASLRSAIWALRSALGPDFGSCLVTDRDTVTLAADGLWVDLREVRRLIAQGQSGPRSTCAAGTCCRNSTMTGSSSAREELDRDVAAALPGSHAQAAPQATRRPRSAGPAPGGAVPAGRVRRSRPDPGPDPGGRCAAALAALAKLRERLDSELGIGVSAATAALVSRLIARPPPAAAPPDAHRGAAPAEARRASRAAAGLIGREQNFDRAGHGLAGRAERLRRSRAAGRRGRHRQDQAGRGTAGGGAAAAPDATLIAGTTAAGPGRTRRSPSGPTRSAIS